MTRLVRRLMSIALSIAGLGIRPPCGPCHADVVPAACFGDHMVLQREMPLPVWGKADPGERITVEFGDESAATVADRRGDWRVTLPAMPASAEPRSLVIRAGNRVEVSDVLVGEVWLCAGQSNMLLPLAKCADARREIAAASRPSLRLLAMQSAATGDRVAYTPEQVRRLVPREFCTGAWAVCSPESARGFSAVGYFLGGRLVEKLDVPVGVICVAVGGTPTEAWLRREALAGDPAVAAVGRGDWTRNAVLAGWCVERAAANLSRARRAGEAVPGDALGPNHPFKPGFMWEAGIAPLVPLAIRGVAWYQGESNADSPARVAHHASLLTALVRDWRRQWGRPDLPFVAVQLPGMNRPDWPAFRETQRRTLAVLPHTGLVVTIDLGEKGDVHPGDKRPVGERIADWAVARVYGQADDAASAPVPHSAEFADDGTVTIRFDPAGVTLRTRDGDPPRHFETAGRDGVFRPARARIEGDHVVIEPTDASPARRVRYAWLPFPEPPVNLANAAGLPAAPFLLEHDGRRDD